MSILRKAAIAHEKELNRRSERSRMGVLKKVVKQIEHKTPDRYL